MRRGKVLAFLGLSFGASWAVGLLLWLLKPGPLAALGLAVAYMWGPALGALVAQKLWGEGIVGPLALRFNFNGWWLLGVGFPAALALLVVPLALAIPGVQLDPSAYLKLLPPGQAEIAKSLPLHPFWLTFVNALLVGPTLNAAVALGEELGWRGFLQRELKGLGFWRSSAVVGAVWGLWHAPLVLQGHNYPEAPVLGLLLMTLWCVLLAPPFAFVRLKAGSVIPAAIAHGTLNALAGLPLLVLSGPWWAVRSTGLPGFLALALLNALLALWLRRRPLAL